MKHPVRIDVKHRYWIPTGGPQRLGTGKSQVPGYSEICAAMGVTRPNDFHTEQGRLEGKALHVWLAFLVRGKVPDAPPPASIAGRVEGIKKFIRDTSFVITGGEKPVYDPATNVACTPDLYGHVRLWTWVLDAKRGAKTKTHALQTACQSINLNANEFRAQKRGALYLRDGGYRLVEHDDRADLTRWEAIAAGYHAMTPAERAAFAVAVTVSDLPESDNHRILENAFAARSFYL